MDLNNLNGTIPEFIATWSNLRLAYVSLVLLPVCYCLCVFHTKHTLTALSLSELLVHCRYFDGNDFTGSVPEGLCNLPELEELWADCLLGEVTCSCCTICV